MNVARYSKAIAAVCGAIAVAVSDGLFDTHDVITVALALATAAGVYAVPNTQGD